MGAETFLEHFKNQAEKQKEKIAIIDADWGQISYSELDEYSARIAEKMRAQGVKEKDPVAIVVPNGINAAAAMLAAMKVGAAFAFLNPQYPKDRLEFIYQDCSAVLVVTPEFFGDVKEYEEIPAEADLSPDDPALLVYTSGSTGKPKGVRLDQKALRRGGERMSTAIAPNDTDILGLGAPFFFIAGLQFLLAGLERGITMLTIPAAAMRDPVLLGDLLAENAVTMCFISPKVLRYFKSKSRTLRLVIVGSERVSGAFSEDYALLNGYGSSETCGGVCFFPVDRAYDNTPVGKSVGDEAVYILDENGNEVEEGEICLAGYFADCYLNLPEESAKTFIPNPFQERDGFSHLVKTGDLGKRLADGNVVYLNRRDWMIKINGQRVEPGEIESQLRNIPGITDAAVKDFTDPGGLTFLAAYYVAETEMSESAIKEALKKTLPDYMIPAFYVKLDRLPINPNGKLDRNALQKPTQKETAEVVPPANDMERSILDICTRIFDFGEFSVTTPFENIGFSSLSYIELATEILKTLGVELKLSELMAGGTTIRSLAELISKTDVEKGNAKERKARYPLAPQQYAYMIPSDIADMYREFIFVEKWQDAEAIREVFVRLINSFPYLYTTFRQEGGEWYQIPYCGALITAEDIPIIEKDPSEDDINDLCVPYDIATADRLFDVTIFRGEKIIVLLHIHHVLMDHVFMEKFVSYISTALRDPLFVPSEQADYYAYATENAAESNPVEGSEPHKVEETETITGIVEAKRMKPVLTEYKLQPAEYLFAALSQAYLEVLGLDEAVIRNIFGGRNDARYFDAAGYFPMAIPVTVKKDSDAFANVKQAIVGSIADSKPTDDYTYNAIANHNYEYPFIMFNCIAYISQTKDFELLSLQSKHPVIAEESKLLTPHINFYCLTQPMLGAMVSMTYDTATLSKEQAQAIIDKVTGTKKPQEGHHDTFFWTL